MMNIKQANTFHICMVCEKPVQQDIAGIWVHWSSRQEMSHAAIEITVTD